MYRSMIHSSRDARMVGFTLSKDCECRLLRLRDSSASLSPPLIGI